MNKRKLTGLNLKTNDVAFYIFCAFSLISFAIWFMLLCVFKDDQLRLFFRSTKDIFSDFTNVMVYGRALDPYSVDTPGVPAEHAYLPLSYILTNLFTKPFPHEIIEGATIWMNTEILILITLFFAGVTAVFMGQIAVLKRGSNFTKFLTCSAVLLSGLYMSAFERGNLIILSVVLTLFFIMNYDSKNKIYRELALISLALAAALKITPALFGVLMLFKSNFKTTLRLVVYGVLAAIGPFLVFPGGFSNIPTLLDNITLNIENYEDVLGCGIKSAFTILEWNDAPENLPMILTYVFAAVIIAALPLFKKDYERVLMVAVLSIMLPGHSETYNALYIIPAVIMFFNEDDHNPFEYLFPLLSLGLIFQPQVYENPSYNYICVYTSQIFVFTALFAALPHIVMAVRKKTYFTEWKNLFKSFFS